MAYFNESRPGLASYSATVRLPGGPGYVEEVLRLQHHALFVPRDFDVSPYFDVVKPAIADGFDFRRLKWSDAAATVAA